MGKLRTFLVCLDNSIGTYYAGQTVSGKVKIHLDESMEMRGVYLNCLGRAYVHWTERRTRSSGKNSSSTETVHRRAMQDYFNFKICIWGSGERQSMDAGYYEFPFSVTLPPNLPTSFESYYGHIRYHCKAYIDRPWKFDPACKEPFTVLAVVDLNLNPQALKPLTMQNHKYLGCLCCKSGPVTATVSLNKMGVVSGESIFINGVIENRSDSDMDRTYAVLTAKHLYNAYGHHKCETKELARVERGLIRPGGSDTWINVPLKVPPLPPTSNCILIDIQYSLVMVVDPSGLSFDLEIEMPIIIGTIPLSCDFHSFRAPTDANVMFNPSAPPMAMESDVWPQGPSGVGSALEPQAQVMGFTQETPRIVLDKYPDMPPPSYYEVTSGKVNIKEEDGDEYTGGNMEYAPRYTYYNQQFN